MAILRVNQIDPAHAGASAGWPDAIGEIVASAPASLRAFELRVIVQGATNGAEVDARQRVRQLWIETTTVLTPRDQQLVVRLDGPLTELAAAIAWGLERPMAMPAVRRFDLTAPSPIISFRAAGHPHDLSSLYDSMGPALGQRVRLRGFAVPAELEAPLLDIDELDDERWPEILSAASLVVDAIANVGGIVLHTHRTADEMTAMLTERLAS